MHWMNHMVWVGRLMMQAVAVTHAPPDRLLSLCTGLSNEAGSARSRYIGPYRWVTKQFIVIYATLNAMGKCCTRTYIHSGFCAPLSPRISASIKPLHNEVMGFHGPLETLCANPERTEWGGGLSASLSHRGAPPTTLSSAGTFQSLFTWWHPRWTLGPSTSVATF